MRDSHEKTHVLRQHQLGLQVQAEVIKVVATQQPYLQQQQGVARTSPTVVDVNEQDGDHLDFLGDQNPNTGPPNNGQFGAKQIQQDSTGMTVVPGI